jgi:hypothetical protein
MKHSKFQKAKKGILHTLTGVFILVGVVFSASFTHAFEIEKRSDVPVENRFVVGPVKLEREVSLGGVSEAVIEVENRTGRLETYRLSFEDFEAGATSEVSLLGSSHGNRSLKEYLSVESSEVILAHGERVRIPVLIAIPADETPGGKFGSLVVSASSGTAREGESGATIIGRVAVLFFVTVPGEITYGGGLESFELVKKSLVWGSQPIPARLVFENTGSAHVNPYGIITVRNVLGQIVSRHEIDPWFVLPGSVRTRDVVLSSPASLGWYTAQIELNRGYDDLIDRGEVSFFVISPGTVIILLAGVALALYVRRKKLTS